MITASRIKHIMGLTTGQVNSVLRRSGYKDDIKDAVFLGISNGGEFCFSFTYFDEYFEEERKAKLWITENGSGELVADF